MSAWQDVLFQPRIDPGGLHSALAHAFGVREADVVVVSEINSSTPSVQIIDPAIPAADVLAQLSYVQGDFLTLAAIYVSERLRHSNVDVYSAVRAMCAELNARALVSDESPDPYSAVLVSPDEPKRTVSLDAASLDERNEYRLGNEEGPDRE